MSRSYRANCSSCKCHSEKDEKRIYNRRYRRAVHVLEQSQDIEAEYPILKEYSDPWSMSKDGKGINAPVSRKREWNWDADCDIPPLAGYRDFWNWLTREEREIFHIPVVLPNCGWEDYIQGDKHCWRMSRSWYRESDPSTLAISWRSNEDQRRHEMIEWEENNMRK